MNKPKYFDEEEVVSKNIAPEKEEMNNNVQVIS
jgi:hypothetical protein